jgi:diguanylate cyclase (GGDEF)-like protein
MIRFKREKPFSGGGVLRVWVFIAAVAVASTVTWAFDIANPREISGPTVPWYVLAVAFYIAEAWVVHLHFRKQAHTLSLTEVGLVLGMFFASPASIFVGQLLGATVALVVHRRQKPMKLAFNVAELTLCSAIAFAIFTSIMPTEGSSLDEWGAALFAAGIAHIAGVLLVSMVIGVAEGKFVAPQLGRTLGITLVGALATGCLGLVAVELIEHEPRALVLLALPAAASAMAFRGYMGQREQREHVEFLYESMRAAQGAPELGLAVGQLLVAGRRLLRAEYAEILLLTSTPGEPVLRSASGASGELLMHPEPLTDDVRLAFEQASEAERSLLFPRRREPHPIDTFLASRGISDGVVGALRGEERVFGVLVVGGRVGDVSTFDENDVTLFETFSGHASVLLENGRLEQSLAQLTELKEELKHQAHHDALTGLPNRVLFADRVAETLAEDGASPGQHAVLFLDLDRFKIVNDSWGHAAGDELLAQVAERISRTVRPDDTPARLGGDEFAVLLKHTDEAGAERAAQRIVAALEATFPISGRDVDVGASIGIALTGPHARTADELLRNADIAMYVAKSEERRNYATYEPSLHTRVRRRQELALELKRAIEHEEIVVHYQPVVSLADESIRAFEALVRWQHPERGLLAPAEFLGVAEESGLIVELGASVLHQALRATKDWQSAVPGAAELGLSVNLAPGEFANDRLVEDLALALTRARFDAKRLTVEITESSVMRDEHGALRAMQELRELGVNISIDDFGTGYSSLSRLADFPIDQLKIPKVFVDRLAALQHGASFADAILRLAASLGLDTVGEGIEEAAQATTLHGLGCVLGQGYHFSRAVTAAQALELLRADVARRGPGELPAAIAV